MSVYGTSEAERWEEPIEEKLEKFVLFDLEEETYCLPILKVQEVIDNHELTLFPNLPEFYHGVISLRGEAIPVINLRKRFGLTGRERNTDTRIIIIDLEPTPIGIQVDAVRRVASVARGAIDSPPTLSGGQKTPFIKGVCELSKGKFTILLDIEEIFTSFEKIQLGDMRESLQSEMERRSQAPPPPEANNREIVDN
jgi:purine-binding chemotaxis protein CheW